MFIAKSKKKKNAFLLKIWNEAQSVHLMQCVSYSKLKSSNFKENNKKAARRSRNKKKIYINLLEQNLIDLSLKIKQADDIIELQKQTRQKRQK